MTDVLTWAAIAAWFVAYAAGWYAGYGADRRRRYRALTTCRGQLQRVREQAQYLQALAWAISERCRKQAELLAERAEKGG